MTKAAYFSSLSYLAIRLSTSDVGDLFSSSAGASTGAGGAAGVYSIWVVSASA